MKQLMALTFVAALLAAPFAEARVGGGRSSGSRGSRGMSRSTQPRGNFRSQPSRPNPYAQPAPSPMEPRFGGGSSFLRGLAGGLAGGFLGSLLFRGTGLHAGNGGGGGFFGLLELLLLAGVGFMVYRWVKSRQQFAHGGAGAGAGASYGAMGGVDTIYRAPEPEPMTPPAEDPIAVLSRNDPAFDPEAYLEARTDDFFRIQAAFMARDLASARDLLAAELAGQIEGDLTALRANGRINKLENITVRQSEIVEAWQELGKEFATVRFKANLLDYTVDEKSGEIVSGSKTQPVKFDEYWTFVRGMGFAPEFTNWRLTAIQQQD